MSNENQNNKNSICVLGFVGRLLGNLKGELNHIGGIMVSLLASIVVVHGFELRLGQAISVFAASLLSTQH
jgi:hypothetical protein